HEAARREDLALAVAGEVVLEGLDLVGAPRLGRRGLGHAHGRDLGLAVGDAGDRRLHDRRRVEARDLLSEEDALREAAVGELEAGDDVARGPDVADPRVQALVDDDEPAVERDALLLVLEVGRARAAPDGPAAELARGRASGAEVCGDAGPRS